MQIEKFTTSPVVSALPAYVEEHTGELIATAALGNDTRKYIKVQTGVKGKADIHPVSASITFSSGASCGFTVNSTTTISKRTIETGMYQVGLEFCDKAMIGKYCEYQVRVAADGAQATGIPFEQEFIREINAEVKNAVDLALWQGNKSAASNNLSDGFITIALADSAVVDVDVSSATTYDTKIKQINKIVETIPQAAKSKGDVRIFVSPAYFESWMMELVAANMYHYAGGKIEMNEFPVPGTSIKVTKVYGLTGSSYALASYVGANGNLVQGTDMENADERYDIWYSKDDRLWKLDIEFNLGAQFAIPAQVVLAKLA